MHRNTRSVFVFQCLNNIQPGTQILYTELQYSLVLPKYTTNWGQSRSDFIFVKEYNSLADTVKNSKSLAGFIRNFFHQP